ncbi:PTS sugar transporter subunit IIA [Sporolactobacillus laevolacticus]|uniref:PTS sugar transporter subunit IIA n=1 Tax=Sporolactobacillus laevolacticus TaxID=33018 RepID=UPI0025B51F45|nr:PTS sugar transporter subunit IIA [Sporolactobacillus laevolacticus]MDN3955943.1 glycoside-pentoside-hexuronide (GPH):cation symporter [Sporolactobacillus laevolacticus]
MNNKHSITSRVSYAFGAFGHDMFFATLSTYFIMFVTTHLFNTGSTSQNDMMISIITLIIFLLRFVELAVDPLIGNAIDNTRTRWGKFKPWVVIGGGVGSISLIFLFTDFGGLTKSNPVLYLVLFAIIYILMDMFYSFKDIAYWSMIPALSFDSHEREKTATFARIGSTIGGNIVGVIVMPLVLLFSISSNHGTGDSRGWFWFAVIVGTISFVTAVIVGFGTKEIDSALRKNKEQTKFKDVFKVLINNDQLMWLSLSYGLYTIGVTLTNSMELYYFSFILGDASKFSILAILNTIVGLFAVSVFPSLAKRWKRKNVFFISIAIMVLGLLLFSFADTSLPLVIAAAVLFFIPQPLIFLVVLMTITDAVEYGQLKEGHRDESLTLSVRPLLDKLAGAVSNGVVGLTAVWVGMTTGASASSITSAGRLTFKFMMLGIPFLFVIIGTFVFFKKVKLNEKMHAEIVDELEKKWGKNFDATEDDEFVEQSISDQSDESALTIYAPVDGEFVPLEAVNDDVFSSGKMGQGFAIKPKSGKIYAPFDGLVRMTFSTRHAVGIVSKSGAVALIHVGLGTVNLKGEGFTTYFDRGKEVKRGELLIEFSPEIIAENGYDDVVITVFTNSDSYQSLTIEQKHDVHHNEIIAKIIK